MWKIGILQHDRVSQSDLLLLHPPIEKFLRQQGPPEDEAEEGEIKHGRIGNMSNHLHDIRFLRLLRDGVAGERMRFEGSRDLTCACEDGEGAAAGDLTG